MAELRSKVAGNGEGSKMARRWRGSGDEQLTMATASEHGEEGKEDGKERNLTPQPMAVTVRTGEVRRRRDRRRGAMRYLRYFEESRRCRAPQEERLGRDVENSESHLPVEAIDQRRPETTGILASAMARVRGSR